MHLHLLRKIWRFPKTVLKRFVSDLLRLVLLSNRPGRMAQAGFVLPTTVLLVLMVVLTATALTYRTVNRSQMGIAQREQVRVANVASPAIDRAKSKIEFIFTNDTRLTSGLPTPEVLASMMLDEPLEGTVDALVPGEDPFTLPGETRLDINGDGDLDNAWAFTDSNTGERIAYSILVETEGRDDPDITVTSPVDEDKAMALVTRTGPVAATSPSPQCSNARAESGWQVVDSGSSSTLQKNFQINVFVPNTSDVNRTLEAFEFQQSRIAERGNKWAAWFRYDLEIYPGSPFVMNGAMHTDSNLIVGAFENNSQFTAFKISSHNSCVYGREASEITVGVGTRVNPFEGQIVRGSVVRNQYETANDTRAIFHIWNGDDQAPITNRALTGQNDSVSGGTPGAIAVNPLVLFAQDRLEPIGGGWSRDNTAWNANPIHTGGADGAPRVFNRRMPKPFVDDLFRADNRWGPKPRYSETIASLDITNTSEKVGNSIDSSLELLRNKEQGLDGFWERQAIANGLRLVVGERLELGNPRQWNFEPTRPDIDPEVRQPTDVVPQDRLYPPTDAPRVPATGNPITVGANEYRQKRSLRDNLSAVQGMVVYHYKKHDGEFPAACMAFTAHPGTPATIAKSRTFAEWETGAVKTDFFNGQGTNGWEFQFPTTFDTASEFATEIAAGKPLGIALRNLAYFAGDPNGGAPSFPAVQDSHVHPFPHQAMWGDFSPLRRVLDAYDVPPPDDPDDDDQPALTADQKYAALSAADQATLHSAACTLSLLASNLKEELNEYELLADMEGFPNLTSVSGRGNNLVGAIITYMKSGGSPGPQYTEDGTTLIQRLGQLKLDRLSWAQNRIYNILRTQLAKRDGDGNIELDADGKLVLVGPDGTEYTDGVPLKDLAGDIRFDQVFGVPLWDSEGNQVVDSDVVIVPDPEDGGPSRIDMIVGVQDLSVVPAATITFLNNLTVAYLTNNFEADLGVRMGGAAEYLNRITFKQWLALLPHGTGNISQENIELFAEYSTRVNRIYSLIRDRDRGFRAGKPTKTFDDGKTTRELAWDPETGFVEKVEYGTGNIEVQLKTNCDPNIFRPVLPGGGGGDDNVGISGLIGCSKQEEMPIRNPSLYYLFPLQEHSHFGAGYHLQPGAPGYTGSQPDEEYITQTYISGQNSAATRFKPVATDADDDDNKIIRGVDRIAAVPAARTELATTWTTPANNATADTLLQTAASVNAENRGFSINICGKQQDCFDLLTGDLVAGNLTGARVSFLDKGIFDGREQLAIRVADLDMGRLTLTNVPGVTPAERWIPDTECVPSETVDCNLFSEGIVYAFREDAVREDEIVRPKHNTTDADDCLTIASITSANCRMRTTPGNEQDPPLTEQGISLKPVDYYADPDRRPHGFRFRNGADMSAGRSRRVGMTFVTDNSVYIMGDFNLHSTAGTAATVIEEFTDTISDEDWTPENFYDDRDELDDRFARPKPADAPSTETWRPVEILADAFTVISNDFRDGSAQDTFTINRPTNQSAAQLANNTSYTNQSRPNQAQTAMVRENTARSPIWINRNGSAFAGNPAIPIEAVTRTVTVQEDGEDVETEVPIDWTVLTSNADVRRRNLNLVTGPVRVNAVLIGGLVPSRPSQGYGGLHNFPRMIQHWDSGNNQRALIINGSFLQLNFSTASTGPFEHDAWEPGANPHPTEQNLGYYFPPERRWGYDPGLLYYPPAAASRRFASVGNLRSEYFRDLPVDDPYVRLLRCAEDEDGDKIFDATIQGTCPF